MTGALTLKDRCAIAGVGATPYYRRGESLPQLPMELAAKALLAACEDAGTAIDDVDGLALYSMGFDTSLFAQWLGLPEIRFTAMLTGGGGGAAGSVGLAAAAVATGQATCVASIMTLQQAASRFGASFAPRGKPGAVYSAPPSPEGNFIQPAGLMAPGQMFAVLAQRHMHVYGTTRDHLAEVAMSARANAVNRETALMRTPMTRDDYFAARMISSPLCLYDCDIPCDGSTAVVVSNAAYAKDAPRLAPRVETFGTALYGRPRWEQWEDLTTMVMHDSAAQMWTRTDLEPSDVDIAELYDGFSILTLLWIEALQFVGRGEAGPFLEGGRRIALEGDLPINTHGGQLSSGRLHGYSYLHEAIVQLRGDGGDRQVVKALDVAAVAAGGGNTCGCLLLTR